MSLRSRYGFTVLELMLAIALSAGLLVVGRALSEQVAGLSEVIALNAAVKDSARVRARTLRSIVRNIDTSADSLSFLGDGRTAEFTSWCTNGPAVKERCSVSLTVDSVVTLTDPSGSVVLLRRGVPGALRYLGDSRDGGRWYLAWGPGIILPLAIGIIFGTDTTVLRIGDRG